MKVIIILVFLILSITSQQSALAQDNSHSWIVTDVGFNSVWILNQNIYGNQELDYSTKFSFSGAACYRYFFGKYGFSLGLGIINLGQNYSGEMAGADAVRRINLNYLQLPLMATYRFNVFGQEKCLIFGPTIMLLLSAKQEFSRSGGRPIPNPDLLLQPGNEITNRFKAADVVLAFEAANIFPLKLSARIKTIVSFNSGFGLLDINQEDYRIPNIHHIYKGSRNFYFGVRAGLIFNPKGKR